MLSGQQLFAWHWLPQLTANYLILCQDRFDPITAATAIRDWLGCAKIQVQHGPKGLLEHKTIDIYSFSGYVFLCACAHQQ